MTSGHETREDIDTGTSNAPQPPQPPVSIPGIPGIPGSPKPTLELLRASACCLRSRLRHGAAPQRLLLLAATVKQQTKRNIRNMEKHTKTVSKNAKMQKMQKMQKSTE